MPQLGLQKILARVFFFSWDHVHGVNGASSGKSGKEKKRVKANSERPEVKRKRAHRQDAIEKNYCMKIVPQNMVPELAWILVLRIRGAQGKKGRNEPNAPGAKVKPIFPQTHCCVHLIKKNWLLQLQRGIVKKRNLLMD